MGQVSPLLPPDSPAPHPTPTASLRNGKASLRRHTPLTRAAAGGSATLSRSARCSLRRSSSPTWRTSPCRCRSSRCSRRSRPSPSWACPSSWGSRRCSRRSSSSLSAFPLEVSHDALSISEPAALATSPWPSRGRYSVRHSQLTLLPPHHSRARLLRRDLL